MASITYPLLSLFKDASSSFLVEGQLLICNNNIANILYILSIQHYGDQYNYKNFYFQRPCNSQTRPPSFNQIFQTYLIYVIL